MDRLLAIAAIVEMALAMVFALVFGEWDKGTYFMANAAVLIGAVKL